MHLKVQNIKSYKKLKLNDLGSEQNTDIHNITTDKHRIYKMSLIIPVLQEEKMLEQSLKLYSKELRKKYDFELIVSDGGSTDGTIEIARKYADKIIEHKGSYRQTIAEGRNNGAEIADSDILVFINGDSIPANHKEFFDTITDFSNNSKIDALACYVSAFPEEVLLKDRIFYTLHNSYVKMLNFIGLGMGRGECQVVKREIFEKAGGYNSKIVAGEDFDLYRRISKIGKIKFERKLHVFESPRRFRKYGYIKTISYWLLNSLTVMLFNKSASKEWEAIR